MVGILAHIPVSMTLQREDFRSRLAAGDGLSVAEFVYSVVMALDSVAITADVELGGVDQLLNLQMCRKVMEIREQTPEVIITTPLIEGTDGTGAKMSKSKGNYVGLSSSPDEIFGRVMSIPDHLIEPYLKQLTEWTDEEIATVTARVANGTAHPMAVKRILAGEVTATLHGLEAAEAARAEFAARFSKRTFGEAHNLPTISLKEHAETALVTLLTQILGFAPSNSAARRVAAQNRPPRPAGPVRVAAEGAPAGVRRCTSCSRPGSAGVPGSGRGPHPTRTPSPGCPLRARTPPPSALRP